MASHTMAPGGEVVFVIALSNKCYAVLTINKDKSSKAQKSATR